MAFGMLATLVMVCFFAAVGCVNVAHWWTAILFTVIGSVTAGFMLGRGGDFE